MDQNYWIGRWQRGETTWHQEEVEPSLITYFSDLEPTRVLVPFCGKSRDLSWLIAQRHEVIGVEVSELACQSYFQENGISYRQISQGSSTLYQGGNVSILNADFLTIERSHVGEIGAVYDRAALIALPSDMRMQYTQQMIRLVRSCAKSQGFKFLQIILERTPTDPQGPPFSVTQKELETLYGGFFDIRFLHREDAGKGAIACTKREESAYLLQIKES